jgi:hypothetical protein
MQEAAKEPIKENADFIIFLGNGLMDNSFLVQVFLFF